MSNAHEQRIESEREFHNRRFATDDDPRESLGHWYQALEGGRQRMQSAIRRWTPQAAVLEYGVADGGNMAFHRQLSGTVASYAGIDISDEAIRHVIDKARSLRLDNFTFAVMNAEALTFPDDSFDLVFGTGILHHLELDRAFSEMSRTMRAGAHAVFFEPMGHNPLLNLFRRRTPAMRTPDEHPFLMSDFAIARRYFSEVDVEYFGLTTPLAVPLQRWRVGSFAMKACEAADAALNALPLLGRYAWHAVLILTR